jgi:hypothetical protein
VLATAGLIWLLVASALLSNAAMREFLYRPVLGTEGAQVLENLLGAALVAAAAYLFVRNRPGVAHRQWVRVGLLWGALAILLDLLSGLAFAGWTLATVLRGYNPFAGQLGLLAPLSALLSPIYWSRKLYRRSNALLWFKP